jgi:hypothetical protein
MEYTSQHRRQRALQSKDVTKTSKKIPSPKSGGTDHFLVMKSAAPKSLGFSKSNQSSGRLHPWGPDTQALPDIQTVAGDTVTMGSSSWTGGSAAKSSRGFGAKAKTKTEKILERDNNERKSLLSRTLRLEQEEEADHFNSLKVRRGIESARRNLKNMPRQHWKTPYEVDAPRAIMLPRDHPQETSSSGESSKAGTISVEQQIWQGIEQLMSEAFSDEDTSVESSPLPAALMKAISTRSLFSYDSFQTNSTQRKSVDSTVTGDELEMAQVALNSFMDLLLPNDDGKFVDDSSIPTLCSWHTSLDGSMYELDIADDPIALAEMALNSFMDVLMKNVENSRKPASLQLLDLFAWTLRVNVDAQEKLRYLRDEANVVMEEDSEDETSSDKIGTNSHVSEDRETDQGMLSDDDAGTFDDVSTQEDERSLEDDTDLEQDIVISEETISPETTRTEEERRIEEGRSLEEQRLLEEEQRAEDERQRQRIEQDLKRREELLRQKAAEEAELRRLEEEGNRLEELLRMKLEEAKRLNINTKVQENSLSISEEKLSKKGESESEEYMKPLNDNPSTLIPLAPPARRRADSERKQRDLESKHNSKLDESDAFVSQVPLAAARSPNTRDDQHGTKTVAESSISVREKSPSLHKSRLSIGLENLSSPQDSTPRSLVGPHLPRQLSSVSIPTLSSLGTDTHTDSSLHDTVEPLKSEKSRNPIWDSIGGLPIVVSSDDDKSIDPSKLSNQRARRSSGTSIPNIRMQAYSSMETKRRRASVGTTTAIGITSIPSQKYISSRNMSNNEESIMSIDPSTLPNLSTWRNFVAAKQNDQSTRKVQNFPVPEWAAIGGKQIMMTTADQISSTNTNISPETAESGILPSSFHSKQKLSSSGSVSTPSTRTLHLIHSQRNLMQNLESSSVLTPEDLPDLKSLSEASFGESSFDSDNKDPNQTPKLFASKYSPRGSQPNAKAKIDERLEEEAIIFKESFLKKSHAVFTESFVDRMESGGQKKLKKSGLPSSFITSGIIHEGVTSVLPSSFVASAGLVHKKEELPSSFIYKSQSVVKNNDMETFDEETSLSNDFDNSDRIKSNQTGHDSFAVQSGDEKKKKEKKKNKKKKKKNKKEKVFFRTPSQRNLVVSAPGDVFLDDVQANSLQNLPKGHFDDQIHSKEVTPKENSPNGSVMGTEIRSLGSAGDIHLGSSTINVIKEAYDDENSVDSEMSIDPELRLDELRNEGTRFSVPETKDIWKKRRQPISIIKSIKKCFVLPMRRSKQKGKPYPDLSNSNGDLCLLHEVDKPYDRTPVLIKGTSMHNLHESGFDSL